MESAAPYYMRIRFSNSTKNSMFMEDEEKDKEEGDAELPEGALDEVLDEETDEDEEEELPAAGEDDYNERDWA